METLNKQLFAGFTVLQAIIAAVVVLIAAPMVSRFLQKKKDEGPMSKHRSMSSCGACGWTGSVSKHVPRCPKCSAPLVAQ